MNKPLILMVILSATALSANAFACDGENTPDANGFLPVARQNMSCHSVSNPAQTFRVSMDYSWTACMEKQYVSIFENKNLLAEYKDAAIIKQISEDEWGYVEYHDVMLVKDTGEARTYKFAPEKGNGLESGLQLTHTPDQDKKVYSDWSQEELLMKSFAGTLSLSDRSESIAVVCDDLPIEKN